MVDGNFGMVVTDPLGDGMYAVCENCPTRPECTYFASGQVAQCSTVVGAVSVDQPQEYAFKVNEQLERQFDKDIRKAGVRVIRNKSPRRTGYSDFHCDQKDCRSC